MKAALEKAVKSPATEQGGPKVQKRPTDDFDPTFLGLLALVQGDRAPAFLMV